MFLLQAVLIVIDSIKMPYGNSETSKMLLIQASFMILLVPISLLLYFSNYFVNLNKFFAIILLSPLAFYSLD